MSGEVLARRLLRLDALYCAGAGALVLILIAPLAELFDVPPALLVATGIATIAWAMLLHILAARFDWRTPVTMVAAANLMAALAVAALAVVAPATAARLLLAAVAIEVTAFAAGQIVALRRA